MTEPRLGEAKMLPAVPAVLLIVIRKFALWGLIPLAVLFWLLAWPWLIRYSKSLWQFVTWVDYNFSVSLVRGPLRPLIEQPYLKWLPLRRIKDLTVRTGLTDLL